MTKKLYRSLSDKKIAGVCGGIAAYFNVDATIIRVVFVLVSLFSAAFPGLLIYLILCLVIPTEPLDGTPYQSVDPNDYQQPFDR